MPSKHLILCHPLLLPSIFPIIRVFSQRVSCSHQVAKVLELVSTSVLPKSIQGWFPLGLTGLISLQSKGLSRVFSNTTVQKQQLCLLYHPAVTSVHDYCKDHSLNYMDLCLETWCVWFLTHCLGFSSFSVKKQLSPNFKLAVAIHSDFRHHEKEICHCFHLSPFYLPWSDGTACHDLSFFNTEF